MEVGDPPGVNKDGRYHSCQDIFSPISIIEFTRAKVSEWNVQIIELFSVGIWALRADRYLLSIYFSWLLFDDLRDDLGVLLRQPAEKRWNAHFAYVLGNS